MLVLVLLLVFALCVLDNRLTLHPSRPFIPIHPPPSGARIGMAQSLKSRFQVCFNDERDPSRGFKYIYLR